MSNDEKAFDQLMAARFLTQKFGVIHGVQVDQLIIYGYLYMQHLKYGELEVSVDTEGMVVQYAAKTRKKADRGLKKLLGKLRSDVQFLLGPEWDLRVIQNGKTILNVTQSVAEKLNAARRTNAGASPKPAE